MTAGIHVMIFFATMASFGSEFYRVFQIDLHQPLDLEVTLENFPVCRLLTIPPETTDLKTKIYLQDVEKRILELLVIIKAGVGGSQRVHIFFCLQYSIV